MKPVLVPFICVISMIRSCQAKLSSTGTHHHKLPPPVLDHPDTIIVNLPGVPGEPSFRQYSGYLKATGTRKLFYWFVESERSPETDPLVVWYNGGPGCSSVDGLLSEHGPFLVNDDGATLRKNPFSWNKVANMLYVESPAGVGFSYAEDDTDYYSGDDQASLDNYWSLKDFFQKYPEFSRNDFFISGESYGGMYIPTLAERILDDSSINLKGFLIGNSYSDKDLNDNTLLYFLYYHGIIDQKMWLSIVEACCVDGNSTNGNCDFTRTGRNSNCSKLFYEALGALDLINPYNIHKECYRQMISYPEESVSRKHSRKGNVGERAERKVWMNSYPCLNNTAETVYLNKPEVQEALHVQKEIKGFVGSWQVCSDDFSFAYFDQYTSMRNHYLKILASRKVRILLYNGDLDAVCNYISDEWFVDSLQQELLEPWTQWHYTGQYGLEQVAGYAKHYKNIIFATVKGAGHSTPIDKPEQSFEMFSNFLNGTF